MNERRRSAPSRSRRCVRARTLIGSCAVVALAACSTLPEYAAPKARVVDPASMDMSDVIRYRTLTRSDFKGTQPPEDFAGYADRIGAATCGHILTTPDSQVMVTGRRSPNGETIYRAEPRNLRFFAQMDRNCSWWNPKDLGLPTDYILEHEQIHFAIFELEARRMNASIGELEVRLQAEADSAEAATRITQAKLEREIQGRLTEIMARSRAFDEDTSMGHKPRRQARWRELVESELAASGD